VEAGCRLARGGVGTWRRDGRVPASIDCLLVLVLVLVVDVGVGVVSVGIFDVGVVSVGVVSVGIFDVGVVSMGVVSVGFFDVVGSANRTIVNPPPYCLHECSQTWHSGGQPHEEPGFNFGHCVCSFRA